MAANSISRRGLIGLLLALIGWRPRWMDWVSAPIDTRQRPWNRGLSEGADPLDYGRWRDWIGTKLDTFYPRDSTWEPYEGFCEMDEGGKIALYCIMCELADGSVETHGS